MPQTINRSVLTCTNPCIRKAIHAPIMTGFVSFLYASFRVPVIQKQVGNLQLQLSTKNLYARVIHIKIFQKLRADNFNSLTTKKQTTKFSSANFQKMLSPSYIMLGIQKTRGQTV